MTVMRSAWDPLAAVDDDESPGLPRSEAFEEANRLIRAAGSAAWSDWTVTFALARWLAGDELSLTDPNERNRTMEEPTVELGKRYEDIGTGFIGICTGRFEYLSGSTRALLEAVNNDGEPLEHYVDAGRLRATGS